MTRTDQSALTVLIDAELMRRLKIEAAMSGETNRELVQIALVDLLDRRAEDRRDAASQFGRCGE